MKGVKLQNKNAPNLRENITKPKLISRNNEKCVQRYDVMLCAKNWNIGSAQQRHYSNSKFLLKIGLNGKCVVLIRLAHAFRHSICRLIYFDIFTLLNVDIHNFYLIDVTKIRLSEMPILNRFEFQHFKVWDSFHFVYISGRYILNKSL